MSNANPTVITTATRTTHRASSWSRLEYHNLAGWLFSLPWTVIFLIFLALPIVASFILSFTDFSFANLQDLFSAHFIGFQNYVKLAHDQTFLTTAENTLYVVVVGVPLNVALALLIAVGVNRGVNYVKAILRLGYYLPVVTSIVAIGVVWRFLLDPNAGLINNLLLLIGLHGPDWLGNPLLAMPSIITVVVWRNVGFAMVILLAGLQGIDKTLYEASHIDGAGAFARFRYITIPMLRPVLLFVTVITSIGFLQVFQEPYVMTQGGPLNKTLTVSYYLYQQGFNFFNLGYASAMAYVLFLAIVILTLIQFRLLRSQT
jgi:multiple sugar transport system permease protein